MLAVPVLYCKILSSWPFIVLDTDPSWSDQAQAVVCGRVLLARLFTPTAEQCSLRFNFLLSADTQDDLKEHNQLKWRHALGCNHTFPLIINCLLCLWPNRYSTFHRIRITVWNYCRLLGIRYQLDQLGGFWPEARKCHTSHKYHLPPLLVKHRILLLVFTPTRYLTDHYY